MKAAYFSLFANCFLTKGASESIIHDAHRNRYLPVKQQIADLLDNELKNYPVSKVKEMYPDWVAGIDAYLQHFVENDYGFLPLSPTGFCR